MGKDELVENISTILDDIQSELAVELEIELIPKLWKYKQKKSFLIYLRKNNASKACFGIRKRHRGKSTNSSKQKPEF